LERNQVPLSAEITCRFRPKSGAGLLRFLHEKREIDAEVVVQTMLSVALTVAISTSNIEDVANFLESLAAGLRRGEFTGNNDGIGNPNWPKHQ
jgi:hypothetical protein